MLRYLIAAPVDDIESVEFVKLRDKYRTYAPKWHITLDPHITIVRPSPAKVDIDQAIELFKVANMPSEFRVKFSGFDAFINHDSSAVFAKPDETKDFELLNKLFLPISKKILNLDPNDWPFLPHLTLVNRLDRDAGVELLNILKGENIVMDYLFSRVVLFSKNDSDTVWQEAAKCKLAKG